jgi:hypothetical protein
MEASWLLIAVLLAIGGCSHLLPRGSSDTSSTFASFAEAEATASATTPFRTHAGQLKELGFDRVNPLGPFQPAGDGAGAAILR